MLICIINSCAHRFLDEGVRLHINVGCCFIQHQNLPEAQGLFRASFANKLPSETSKAVVLAPEIYKRDSLPCVYPWLQGRGKQQQTCGLYRRVYTCMSSHLQTYLKHGAATRPSARLPETLKKNPMQAAALMPHLGAAQQRARARATSCCCPALRGAPPSRSARVFNNSEGAPTHAHLGAA